MHNWLVCCGSILGLTNFFRSKRSAELVIIISYPTSASGIIVLLKTPPKNKELGYNENKKAQKITRTHAIL